LADDSLLVLCDGGGGLQQHLSYDNGRTWAYYQSPEMNYSMPDRVIELSQETWLTTGHVCRGKSPVPETGSPFLEQTVFVSENQGQRWTPRSLMAIERCLSLCEASMARLPDGRIIALLREDSGVFEPMYFVESSDEGRSWSEPAPTPLIGHRPTLGLTRGGRLLVTYRNVAPDAGVAAFLGTLDGLRQDFAVHGLAPEDGLESTSEGLLATTSGGLGSALRWVLRPVTDPRRARVDLEIQVQCLEDSQENACGVYCGCWWKILPDALIPALPGAGAISLPEGRVNSIRFHMEGGSIAVQVNKGKRREYALGQADVRTRPILAGNLHLEQGNAGRQLWRAMRLRIEEPHRNGAYEWAWASGNGRPDAWARANILQLAGDRGAARPDFGYTGWVETTPGEFLCAYHHSGGPEGYKPLETAHVQCTVFSEKDFQ